MIHDLSSQKGRNAYAQSNEEKFIKKFGQTDKEVFTINGFKGNKDAKCEMAINFGYVWIEKHKVWVDKNANMTEKEEKIFDNLRKNNKI
jgi:hypothetical protein